MHVPVDKGNLSEGQCQVQVTKIKLVVHLIGQQVQNWRKAGMSSGAHLSQVGEEHLDQKQKVSD